MPNTHQSYASCPRLLSPLRPRAGDAQHQRDQPQALGRSGQMQGDVYTHVLPRTDLTVTVDGVPIRAGFALGSWGAFKSTGADAITHGDLVLTEAEVHPVISKLFEGGLEITALHNHLVGETHRDDLSPISGAAATPPHWRPRSMPPWR